jgi:hypothetical protein
LWRGSGRPGGADDAMEVRRVDDALPATRRLGMSRHLLAGVPDERRDLLASAAGCSSAANWPPFRIAVQRRMSV